MLIDISATMYSREQSQTILDFLYRYYHERERGKKEGVNMLARLETQGFAGFTRAVESILNSKEMKERAKHEFDELWSANMAGNLPTSSDRERWEPRLRHGRAQAKKRFVDGVAAADTKLRAATKFLDSKDYAAAQALLSVAVEEDVPGWLMFHRLGRAYKEQKKYEEAIAAYHEAIRRNPDDDHYYSLNDLKFCYEASGLPARYEQGLTYFKTIVGQFPERWNAYHQCGWFCWKLERLDEAISYYKEALLRRRRDSKSVATWAWSANDLRKIYEERDRPAEAYEFFVRMCERQPNDWAVWYACARLERKHTKNHDEAIAAYRKTIELRGDRDERVRLSIDLGNYMGTDLGRFRDAYGVFEEASRLNDKDWRTWRQMAWAAEMIGKNEGAVEQYAKGVTLNQKALQLNQEHAWTWIGLAVCFRRKSPKRAELNNIFAWEAYHRALLVESANDAARTDALRGIAELEEDKNSPLWAPLKPLLEAAFSLEEINSACFELGIEYENLEGRTKSGKIVDFLKCCQREGKMLKALNWIHITRPQSFPPLVQSLGDASS